MSTQFDAVTLRTLFFRCAQQVKTPGHKNEIETSSVVDLLKEFDRKKFATITLKEVQNQIDIDQYGFVCYESVENFALEYFSNNESVSQIISVFYDNYSSDKGKRFDNQSDRLIPDDDMVKLLKELSPDLGNEDATEMCKELHTTKEPLSSVKKLADKLLKH